VCTRRRATCRAIDRIASLAARGFKLPMYTSPTEFLKCNRIGWAVELARVAVLHPEGLTGYVGSRIIEGPRINDERKEEIGRASVRSPTAPCVATAARRSAGVVRYVRCATRRAATRLGAVRPARPRSSSTSATPCVRDVSRSVFCLPLLFSVSPFTLFSLSLSVTLLVSSCERSRWIAILRVSRLREGRSRSRAAGIEWSVARFALLSPRSILAHGGVVSLLDRRTISRGIR